MACLLDEESVMVGGQCRWIHESDFRSFDMENDLERMPSKEKVKRPKRGNLLAFECPHTGLREVAPNQTIVRVALELDRDGALKF